jgi:hypothetical protein
MACVIGMRFADIGRAVVVAPAPVSCGAAIPDKRAKTDATAADARLTKRDDIGSSDGEALL